MEHNDLKRCYNCMNLIEGQSKVCPDCDWRQDAPPPEGALRPGSLILGRYFVGRLCSQNTESCLYSCFDTEEDVRVWIREFFPVTLARRSHSDQGLRATPEQQNIFEEYRQEYRELFLGASKLGHINGIVPVQDCFEAHGTVYSVERYLPTTSLEQYIEQQGGSLAPPEVKKMFLPLFTALARFHSKGFCGVCLHPGNLHVDSTGRLWFHGLTTQNPIFWETHSQQLVGYVAPEVMREHSFFTPATDVYSLGAVLYRALSGSRPTDSISREFKENLPTLSELDSEIAKNISTAVESAMLPDQKKRTQSAGELSAALLESDSTNTAVFVPQKPTPIIEEEEARKPTVRTIFKLTQISPSVGYFLLGSAVVFMLLGVSLTYLFNSDMFAFFDSGSANVSSASESISQPSLPTGEEVPDFVGVYHDKAVDYPHYDQHFNIVVESSYSEEYPEGVICRQSPPAGTLLEAGETLTIYVSQGSNFVEVPNLEGSSLEFAISTLNELDLIYTIDYVPTTIHEGIDGIVQRTNPAAGRSVRKFSGVVTIYTYQDE